MCGDTIECDIYIKSVALVFNILTSREEKKPIGIPKK
jgi:hypothetical protein